MNPRKKIGPGKRAGRVLVALAIPLVFLLALEGVLRLAGAGWPADFSLRQKNDGQNRIVSNPHFAKTFFGPFYGAQGLPFSIPEEKPPRTYRMVLLGGSALLGVPDPAYGMGRMLELLLAEKYPGVRFEVINTGIPGINSHTVRAVARDAAAWEPDLFIIYMGNNEVVGPYGAESALRPAGRSLPLIRAGIALRNSRVGQVLGALRGKLFGARSPLTAEEWVGRIGERRLRPTDPGLIPVRNHFERNLEDILGTAQKCGARVVLCSVASNLADCPPFASLNQPDLSGPDKALWEEFYQKGREAFARGEWNKALDAFARAGEIDATHAGLAYDTGRAALAAGRFEMAKDFFLRARELDALRLRADNGINGIIQKAARSREGVRFLGAESLAAGDSPHGIPGKGLFYDHVHFAPQGNYLMARALMDAVEDTAPPWLRAEEAPGEPLSLDQCLARLPFTPWDRLQVTRHRIKTFRQGPGTLQAGNGERIEALEARARDLESGLDEEGLRAVDLQYAHAFANSTSDRFRYYKYGSFLMRGKGEIGRAEGPLQKAVEGPPYFPFLLELSVDLNEQGRYREALPLLEEALEISPASPEARAMAGATRAMILLEDARNLENSGDAKGAARKREEAKKLFPATGLR